MDAELRKNMLHQANSAFLALMGQVNILLDGAETFFNGNKPVTFIERVKHEELKSAVLNLGSIPSLLASEIAHWAKHEPPVLSPRGIELSLLNELYANMESMMLFFDRERIKLTGFSLDLVKASYYELLRCNRLL
ncbi:hypothetical protein [Acinetobacter sp.]|uniref:hypothetical protein n=1 Tax=Acinetobacter sp. TaxID=472 RepID=UPI00388E36FD